MKCVHLEGQSFCIGATVDGTIRVWSINNFLGFFGVCRATCESAITVYGPSGEMNAVCTAGEDIRIFSERGVLKSNLIPGQLDGEIKVIAYR